MNHRVAGLGLLVAGLLLAGCVGPGEAKDLDVSDSQSGTRAGAAAADAPATEAFTVNETATEFTLTVDATGGELEVCVIGPPESDCELHFTTVDGKGSTTMMGPSPGDWTVQLTPAGAGPVQYSLTVR